MRPHFLHTRSLCSSVLVLLAACAGESDPRVPEPTDSPKNRAATSPSGSSAVDDGGDDAGTVQDEPAASALPASPEHFEIQLAASECFGSCPVYAASIDEAGQVRFRGERCVARVGVSTREVPASDARALYDALRASPFATLKPRYAREEDGCAAVSTDGPSSTWRVTADGVTHEVLRYSGCEGVPALEELDALEAELTSTLGLADWVGPVRYGCEDAFGRGSFSLKIALAYEGAPIGTLEPAPNDGFVLKSCDGAELVRGAASSDRLDSQVSRWVLMAEDMSTLTLPAVLGEVGSLVIRVGEAFRPAQPGADEGRILGVDAQRAGSDELLSLEVLGTAGC